jgi:hypothetical protein
MVILQSFSRWRNILQAWIARTSEGQKPVSSLEIFVRVFSLPPG